MTNVEFIKQYGKYEFNSLNDSIYQELVILKMNRKIKGFKVSNRKKRAIIYLNNGESKSVDYARIITCKGDF